MKLVVGLGNPGDKYSNTKHNIGFIILDSIAKSKSLSWKFDSKLKSQIAKHTSAVSDTVFVKPQTFMNASGEAVSNIMRFYKITPADLLVIHDDIDLPFGEVKSQFGAGSAGHNGVQNIIDIIGTKDFSRIRFGIGRPDNPKVEIEDWVLTALSDSELKQVLLEAEKLLTTIQN